MTPAVRRAAAATNMPKSEKFTAVRGVVPAGIKTTPVLIRDRRGLMSRRYPAFRFAPPETEPREVCREMWSRGLLAGLVVVLMLFTAACNPDGSSSHSNSQVTINQSSHGCTGSQTVTARNGDNLTVLVENHVSGSYSVEQVVNVVADMNGIANRNVIHANQQLRLPSHCAP